MIPQNAYTHTHTDESIEHHRRAANCSLHCKCLPFAVFAIWLDVRIRSAHTKFKYHIALAVQPAGWLTGRLWNLHFKCIQMYLLNNSINKWFNKYSRTESLNISHLSVTMHNLFALKRNKNCLPFFFLLLLNIMFSLCVFLQGSSSENEISK